MKNNKTLQFILVGVALIVLPLILQGFGNAWVRIADMALLYILLALGLNIVVGYAGLLDLGYVAFYAVGAYTAAILNTRYGVPVLWALPASGLVAALIVLSLALPASVFAATETVTLTASNTMSVLPGCVSSASRARQLSGVGIGQLHQVG